MKPWDYPGATGKLNPPPATLTLLAKGGGPGRPPARASPRSSFYRATLLPVSCSQEGAPCASGAPRPRNPRPPCVPRRGAELKIGSAGHHAGVRPPRSGGRSRLRGRSPPAAVRRPAGPRPRFMLPQAPAGQRCGRLRRPDKRQGQALRALRGLAFCPARLRPGLSPRRCSGAQSGPVGWWPCCAPSAPPVPGGRSRPVPLALRAEPGAGAVRPAGRPALRRGNLNAAREGRPAQRGRAGLLWARLRAAGGGRHCKHSSWIFTCCRTSAARNSGGLQPPAPRTRA